MKPASHWASIFLNRHPINTKECGEVERFIAEVQADALADMQPPEVKLADILPDFGKP